MNKKTGKRKEYLSKAEILFHGFKRFLKASVGLSLFSDREGRYIQDVAHIISKIGKQPEAHGRSTALPDPLDTARHHLTH